MAKLRGRARMKEIKQLEDSGLLSTVIKARREIEKHKQEEENRVLEEFTRKFNIKEDKSK